MFENLTSSVSKTRRRARKSVEIPQTVAFVRALAENDTRITYAALADSAEALGEHTATPMSAGQRGSSLVKNGLPVDLQPFVCRGDGGYAKGTQWPEAGVEVKDMRDKNFIRPDHVAPYLEAFIAHQNAQGEAEVAAEAEVEALDEDTTIEDSE